MRSNVTFVGLILVLSLARCGGSSKFASQQVSSAPSSQPSDSGDANARSTSTTVNSGTASVNITETKVLTATEVIKILGPGNTVTTTLFNTQTNLTTNTVTNTQSATQTVTATQSVTNTVTNTQTATNTVTNTQSVTNTVTATQSVTNTVSQTNTVTATQSVTSTQTVTQSVTNTTTTTATSTVTSTITTTATLTNTVTCNGMLMDGYCFYKTDLQSQSCQQYCLNNGRGNAVSYEFFAGAMGSDYNCKRLIQAFGFPINLNGNLSHYNEGQGAPGGCAMSPQPYRAMITQNNFGWGRAGDSPCACQQ